MADGPLDSALGFCVRAWLLPDWLRPCAPYWSKRARERFPGSHFLRHGIRLDLHLLEHFNRALLRPRGFPHAEWHGNAPHCGFLLTRGFIGGKLFDLYASYTAAFEINMILAGGGIVALLFATMPVPPERAAKIPDAEVAPAS